VSALPEGLSGPSAQTYGRWEAILAERLVPLPDQPAESVRTTLAALWHRAAGREFSSRAAAGTALEPLDAQGEARLAALIERRLQGTPLAHITGRQHFMGLEMLASAEALIPREETELLGRAALEALRAAAEDRGEARAIDLCTGSGNVALALAWHEPRAHVWGADLSAEAIAFAGTNARHLGLHDRVTLLTGDLLEPFEPAAFDGTIDVVACNPPYISSARVEALAGEIRDHEPRLAFDGGPLGIRILARLIDEAPRVLRPGGVLAFEVGLGQGPGVRRRLEREEAWSGVEEIADPAGHTRVLVARKRSSAR
jgi:release factor glutamine methyltransferase